MDREIDELLDAGGKGPKVDKVDDDESRRRAAPPLRTSIGYYARQLPKLKGGKGANSKQTSGKGKGVGNKGGGKGIGSKGGGKIGDGKGGSTGSDMDKKDLDTWHKYRSRAWKQASKDAISACLSPSAAAKFRSAACAAAKKTWNSNS